MLIGALVALLLLGLVIVVPLLNSGDGDGEGGGDAPQAGATCTAAPTSAPAPSASDPAAPAPTSAAPTPTRSATPSADPNVLPAGWTRHEGPTFSIPVPPGWRVTSTGSDTVIFRQSGGVGEMLVQWGSNPKADAVADWKSQEPARKRFVNDYEYLSIERCDWYRTCADWEWLESRDGARIHVRNRGFATASNRGYAIRWEIAESEWQANLAAFDQVVKGFKPDRVN
ncbi:hypothetical protein [Micromonospora sp. NPDC049799]|uniref:hypothetical protein n=1 Tax=Micromonospora sp. NPDC049799 TaxID=3154741 RepID=UPI0034022B0D